MSTFDVECAQERLLQFHAYTEEDEVEYYQLVDDLKRIMEEAEGFKFTNVISMTSSGTRYEVTFPTGLKSERFIDGVWEH